MSVCAVGERSVPLHFFLNNLRRLAFCVACAVSDTKDVRIHGNLRLFKSNVHDHAGRFLSYAGEFDQRIKVGGHLAVVMFDQILTELHHVLRLASVKPDVFDDVREFFRT